MLLPLLLAVTTATGANGGSNGNSGAVHTPHSVASSVAFGVRDSGETEMVIVSRGDARVMSSIDDGVSFQPIAGDGLGKVEAHRVVFYEVPATGEKRFIIATNAGLWKYVPATGEVVEISTGLDPINTYYTDLQGPLPGQDGPVVTINSWGQVYRLNEATDTWTEILNLVRFDENSVVAVSPTFDRAGPAGPNRTIAVGNRGVLATSIDGGTTWAGHPQFNVPALSIYELHITAIELDLDYQNNGVMLLGRGRRDDVLLFGSEGEMWRSDDFATNFTQLDIPLLGGTTLSSGVRGFCHAGMGPNGDDHWYATVYRFPELSDYELGLDAVGMLESRDKGLTWTENGSFQEFIQERSGNDLTAVGLPYRRMMEIAASPHFATDGTIWMGRSEGLYESNDLGSTWAHRRFRPSTQVRAITSGFNEKGEVVAWGGSYGSGMYRYNHATGEAETLTGLGVIYYASIGASPVHERDGLVLGGGQRDLQIRRAAPEDEAWFSVNQIRKRIDGQTGYVRTIALSPIFGGPGLAGREPVFAWSVRFDGSALGETRITFDGLGDVTPINDVYQQPGQRAPYFHDMHFAASFDSATLPRELDIFGSTSGFSQVYRLLNTGDAVTPVFEWQEIPLSFEGTLVDTVPDPRFDRALGTATLWSLSTEKLYRIDELSSDWSNYTVTEYPGIEDYLVMDLELSPDMDLAPALYAATWGGGIFKMDLTDPSPVWEQVGGAPPSVWGECIVLSPDFANDRLIFIGTQRGLYAVEDRVGSSWVKLNNEVIYDTGDPSFDAYSPNDPSNPDPTRPWGWNIFRVDDIPKTFFEIISVAGETILQSDQIGDYCEGTFYAGSKLTVMSFQGPYFGEARVTCWNADTGSSAAPFFDQNVNFNDPALGNAEVEVALPAPGNYTIRVEVVSLPPSTSIMVDAIRLTD